MLLKKILLRAAAIFALGAGVMLMPAAHAQNGYVTVTPAQPSDTTGKIEVLEFFAYSCIHCKTLEPIMQAWKKTLPQDVVVRSVPVAFNASMADLQKLYYSLEALNRLDLHPAAFKAIHEERKRIFTAKAITDWAVEQGVDRKAFEDVFNSFGTQSKINRANELARAYDIDGTPSVAVGGKYLTSPSLAGGYQQTVTQADKLIEMARKN